MTDQSLNRLPGFGYRGSEIRYQSRCACVKLAESGQGTESSVTARATQARRLRALPLAICGGRMGGAGCMGLLENEKILFSRSITHQSLNAGVKRAESGQGGEPGLAARAAPERRRTLHILLDVQGAVLALVGRL